MSRQHPNLYEFRGELLTAREIQKKYKIPDRLVWKGLFDPRKPSLEQMISWRHSHGIFDETNYKYSDSCNSRQKTYPRKPRQKRTSKFTCVEPEPIQYNRPALPEYFMDERPSMPERPQQSLYVGCRFGSYDVISRCKKAIGGKPRISVRCNECGRCFYDLPLNLFVEHTGSKCCCDMLGRLCFSMNLPKRIQKESLSDLPKDISYYQSFVGYKICCVKITGVSQKESNGVVSYIFSAQCPHCGQLMQITASEIVSNMFRHRCKNKKRKIGNRIKNTSCHAKGQYQSAYKRQQCKVHKDRSVEMYEIIKASTSFYTLNYGTEHFMNMCLDGEFLGMKDKITNMFGIV